jgi:hypothetical protein
MYKLHLQLAAAATCCCCNLLLLQLAAAATCCCCNLLLLQLAAATCAAPSLATPGFQNLFILCQPPTGLHAFNRYACSTVASSKVKVL